jgi:hypothetical protein
MPLYLHMDISKRLPGFAVATALTDSQRIIDWAGRPFILR